MVSQPERASFLMRAGLPLLVLALALGGFALLRATRPSTLPIQIEEKVWLVSAKQVVPGPHAPNLLVYGSVEAPRRAALRAVVAADVADVFTAEGRSVEAGELLIVLDERDIDLTLRQRSADLAEIQAMIDSERAHHASDLAALEREQALFELAQRALARAEDLNRRKLGSQALTDEAREALERQALSLNTRQLAVRDHAARFTQLQARRARAEALRDQTRLDRARTRITAPFAGRVAGVPAAPGNRVHVGDLLVEIYATDALEIRAQIPFRYLPVVRAALDRGVELGASTRVDDRPVRVVLERLGGEVDKAGGGVGILCRITQGAEHLAPGRLLALVIDLPPEDATVELPAEALYGLNRIYRLEDQRMAALEVERVGERRYPDGSIRVLVRSPRLQPGDTIITTQLPNAVTGLKVAVAGPIAESGAQP